MQNLIITSPMRRLLTFMNTGRTQPVDTTLIIYLPN
jgi:hypothetical protein